MAKWRVKPNGDADNTISATFEYESGTVGGESSWSITQDVSGILEETKVDRELSRDAGHGGMHKMFTLPTVVAVEIRDKYGLDFYDEGFLRDTHKMAKFMGIIDKEYPLLKSTNRRLI